MDKMKITFEISRDLFLLEFLEELVFLRADPFLKLVDVEHF